VDFVDFDFYTHWSGDASKVAELWKLLTPTQTFTFHAFYLLYFCSIFSFIPSPLFNFVWK